MPEKIIPQNVSFFSEDFKIDVQTKTSNVTERACHEAIEIKYVYEGDVMQMIDADIIVAHAGDITLTNPYEIHTNMEIESYHGKYYLFMVDPDFLSEMHPMGIDLRHVFFAKGQVFHNCIRNDPALQRILLQVVQEMKEQKENYRRMVYYLMSEFFTLLLRRELNAEKSRKRTGREIQRANLLSPALSKIFNDYQSRITVDELASLCHISSYYFCRLFKEEMGVSPIQYITKYRISMAEAMLKDENKTMGEIADRCGFKDLSYFYRCYKKLKGESPKQGIKP